MASQAQIDANRRNSERSTGPKSEADKARAKLNALKDGSHAKTVRRVLPQENAVEIDERIKRWINELNPRNDAERELVIHAAELAWSLDRAKRCENARLTNRVLKAQLKTNERRINEVGELGRRLLYNDRSMAELETIMWGRLIDKTFKMYLDNPPAGRSARKGSPKLAGLEMLPDRALVATRGAGGSATSELGMKKAQIEANGAETQAEKGPEDNIHAIDFGGENQSQTRDEDSHSHG